MKNRIAIIIILSIVGFYANAQNFTMKGRLQDQESKKAVQGATVILEVFQTVFFR